MATTKLLTAADLELMPGGEDFELIDGVLIDVQGVGGKHGGISFYLGLWIGGYADEHGFGLCFSSDTQFMMNPAGTRVLRPDVGLIVTERLPAQGLWRGIVSIPPDLVVEIVSPSNTEAEVRRKVALYLDAGVSLVWVIWTDQHTVSVHRSDHPVQTLSEADELSGEDVLPGFRLPVAQVFAPLRRTRQHRTTS